MQSPKKATTIKDSLRSKAGLNIESSTPVSINSEAVTEGRRPLPARRADVNTLRAKVTELYGIPAAGTAAIPSIESRFKFSAGEFDGELNYLHVEPLLDRAFTLLDRCLSHRSRYDQLQLEKWKLQLELDQFFRLKQVEVQEREAGVDTLAYERAVFETAAEESLEENHRNADAQLKGLMVDLVGAGLSRRMAARELSAWLSAYPLKDGELRGDDATYTFDGIKRTKPEHLFEAARQQADEDGWEQIYSLMSKRYSAIAHSESGRLRKTSLDMEAKWSLADIAFRRQRDQIACDTVWEKAHQAQSPNGIFNYHERIAPVERSFAHDFREALACLAAARQGLKELYDYAPPFPEEGSPGYFDEVVTWAGRSTNRTAQCSMLDQNYVMAVSLKQLTKTQWESGRTSSAWTFDLPEEIFAGQAHVRLRGLSVSLAAQLAEPPDQAGQKPQAQKVAAQKSGLNPETEKAEGFWSARITLPAKGTMRNASGAVKELDQKSLPACYLGRVTDRNSSLQPEVGGVQALHNASPIGQGWKLSLSPKSTDGMTTGRLEDVQLLLHVAVRDLEQS